MKKFWLIAFLLPAVLASCSKEGTNLPGGGDEGEGGTIKIVGSTNREVDEIVTQSRAEGDDYWLKVTGPETFATIERYLGSERTITDLLPGTYTVSLHTKKPGDDSFTYPDYNLPLYGGSHTDAVNATAPVTFPVSMKQINTGIRFIFHESVTSYYKNPVATVTNSDGKSLDLTPADQLEGQEKVAYFDPGELTVTLNDDEGHINIGNEASKKLQAKAKQLWTITLKTSNETGNSIIVDFEVDVEDVDEEDVEWGVGEVTGKGTATEPFSVAAAINAMPLSDVWVEGYILGSTTLDFSRALEEDNLVIGQTTLSQMSKGIAINVNVQQLLDEFELDEYHQLIDMRIAVKGNVGKPSYYSSRHTLATMSNIQRWTPNYFSDLDESVNYYALKTIDRPNLVLKNAIPRLPIGTCVRHEQLPGQWGEDAVYSNILKRDFNSVTAEYSMKMEQIWKTESDYPAGNFESANITVQYAKDNGMRVHGHTLIWSQVVPGWLRIKGENESWTREQWTEMMETYITNVITYYATNYPGVVQSWDVVNEAFRDGDGELKGSVSGPEIDDKGQQVSFFYDKVGPDFIEIAFRAARKALDAAGDTKCKLFYNDYMIVNNSVKRDGIYGYFKEILQKTGEEAVPIDGIGMQCHVEVHPDYDLAKESFAKMAELKRSTDNKNLLIHLSELDAIINNPVYIPGQNGNKYITKWWDGATNPTFWSPDYAQGKSFNMIARAFLENVPEAQQFGITTWGVSDRYSMTDGNHYGHPDWGVLFTKANAPKSAYHGLIEALIGINWEELEANTNYMWRWEIPGGFMPKPW